MAILITGVAGFIGSNLARRLLDQGETVYGVDHLGLGKLSNIQDLIKNKKFTFEKIDINSKGFMSCVQKMHDHESIDSVWHMAANSDIPAGVKCIEVDYKNTFMTTLNTLEVMKVLEIKSIFFASSSAVYGDLGDILLNEKTGPLLPISNYGAMKLASEGLISAAHESFLNRAYLFRFPNVVGIPATHGVILDFMLKLNKDPSTLNVLGNGLQQKAYLHVSELIDAMLFIQQKSDDDLALFNIGASDNGVTVKFIAEEVVKFVSPHAKIIYGNKSRGWVGDVPRFNYSLDKIHQLGWDSKLTSAEAIMKAIHEIASALE